MKSDSLQKILIFTLSLVLMYLSINYCSYILFNKYTNNRLVTSENTSQVKTTIPISGSSSMEFIILSTADEYIYNNPSVEITYTLTDSTEGIESVKNGSTIIGARF